MSLNSSFHGDAVTQRRYYCNPVMQIDQGELRRRPHLKIEGQVMNNVSVKDRKWCQTARDRYDHAYTMKKERNPKKSIFTPVIPEVLPGGTIVQKSVYPSISKKK